MHRWCVYKRTWSVFSHRTGFERVGHVEATDVFDATSMAVATFGPGEYRLTYRT